MNSTSTATDALSFVLKGVGRLFYIVSPKTTTFGNYKQVPDYIAESIPFFILTIALEFLALVFKDGGKGLKKQRLWNASRFSVNDAVGSIGVSFAYANQILKFCR
jgi:alkylglycerol monooxygenase